MAVNTAMPLKRGFNKITSGTCNPSIIHCDADGQLTVSWHEGDDTTELFVEGEDRGAQNVSSVTIVSGTFSFAF